MRDKPSQRLLAKTLAAVLSCADGMSTPEVARKICVTDGTALGALGFLKKRGDILLAGRATWVAPQYAAEVVARLKKQSLEAQRETNRRSRRARREREKSRPFDDHDTPQDYFTQTWREAGTWEHQTTGGLAPATWLCPALG